MDLNSDWRIFLRLRNASPQLDCIVNYSWTFEFNKMKSCSFMFNHVQIMINQLFQQRLCDNYTVIPFYSLTLYFSYFTMVISHICVIDHMLLFCSWCWFVVCWGFHRNPDRVACKIFPGHGIVLFLYSSVNLVNSFFSRHISIRDTNVDIL